MKKNSRAEIGGSTSSYSTALTTMPPKTGEGLGQATAAEADMYAAVMALTAAIEAEEDSRAGPSGPSPPAAFVPAGGTPPKSQGSSSAGAGAARSPSAYQSYPAEQPIPVHSDSWMPPPLVAHGVPGYATSHEEGRQFNEYAREPAGHDGQWPGPGGVDGRVSDGWGPGLPTGTEGSGHFAPHASGMATDDVYRESYTRSSDGRGGDALSDESIRRGHLGREGAGTPGRQEADLAPRFSLGNISSDDESRAMTTGGFRSGLRKEADGRARSPVAGPRDTLPAGDRDEKEAAKLPEDMPPTTRRWCTRGSLMVMAFVFALSLALVTVIVAVYEYLSQSEWPVARGRFGAVRGRRIVVRDQGRDLSVYAFLGVPFAKAPQGSLRFKPPQPLDRPLGAIPKPGMLDSRKSQQVSHTAAGGAPRDVSQDGRNEGDGPLDSLAKRPPCPQQDFYLGRDRVSPVNASEDCLHLNIWAPPWNCTPDTQPGSCEQRAVLFFLYGADFQNGGNSFELYDGRYLSALGDLVVVVPNYRVGALGFLSGPWDNRLHGNAGLHDQRLALEWTLANIGSFGGNVSHVVLAGHDAGASSLGFHLFSGDVNFWARNATRFILQSGGAFHRYVGQGSEGARVLASSLHCPADMASDRALQCLQTASTDGVARSKLALTFAPVFNRAPLFRPQPRQGLERSSRSKGETPQGLEFLLGRAGSEGSYPWFVAQQHTTSTDSRRLATRLLGQEALDRWQSATGITLDSQSADAPFQAAVGDVLKPQHLKQPNTALEQWEAQLTSAALQIQGALINIATESDRATRVLD